MITSLEVLNYCHLTSTFKLTMSSSNELDHPREETSLLMTEELESTTGSGENAFMARRMSYRKLVLASFASISLLSLGLLNLEMLRDKRAKMEDQVTGLAKDSYNELVDFHSGKPIETKMVLDGNMDVLVNEDLAMNCNNNAMTSFNMVNYKNVYAAYRYTCDTGRLCISSWCLTHVTSSPYLSVSSCRFETHSKYRCCITKS